jgi:hypothetical protein
MKTRLTRATLATLLGSGLAVLPAVASASPAGDAGHGHILVLGVEVLPGSFPPVAVAARGCVDLAAGQSLPTSSHHDHLHVGPDGGEFTARTGNIVIPTAPYAPPGGDPVPWGSCADFLAFFGLD